MVCLSFLFSYRPLRPCRYSVCWDIKFIYKKNVCSKKKLLLCDYIIHEINTYIIYFSLPNKETTDGYKTTIAQLSPTI